MTGHVAVKSTDCLWTLPNNLTLLAKNINHAMAQPVNHLPLTRKPGYDPRLVRLGFLVSYAAL